MRVTKGYILVSLKRFRIENNVQGDLPDYRKNQMASKFLHSTRHIEIANETLQIEKEKGKS